jgi:hypothetical protein
MRIVSPSLAGVAEWQTRGIQNPVLATGCGFKSHLRYSTPFCIFYTFLPAHKKSQTLFESGFGGG